jgi:hypothetical protein
LFEDLEKARLDMLGALSVLSDDLIKSTIKENSGRTQPVTSLKDVNEFREQRFRDMPPETIEMWSHKKFNQFPAFRIGNDYVKTNPDDISSAIAQRHEIAEKLGEQREKEASKTLKLEITPKNTKSRGR